jgi:hypothetical protein
MSGFEFVFSLFGLLLGLALAEGLGGLAQALKARHRQPIGWPTALLGVFVSCDAVTFWMYGWAMREVIPITWPFLAGGFAVCAIFYVAASLVFPGEGGEDIEAHFDRHYRLVIGGVLLCNTVLIAAFCLLLAGTDWLWTLRSAVILWSAMAAGLLAILARDRRIVIACLVWMIALYPISTIWR